MSSRNWHASRLRRILVCSAYATWCFLNAWVQLAEGDGLYFARYNPRAAVIPPILCWEVLIISAMMMAWELLPERRRSQRLFQAAFLLICLPPAGIASIAGLRILPFDANCTWPVWAKSIRHGCNRCSLMLPLCRGMRSLRSVELCVDVAGH